MSNKTKCLILLTGCVLFYAVGRYTAPAKTKIVTQTVTVEKKTDDTKTQAAVDRHKETVEVTTKKPDGTTTTTTTTTEDDKARRSSDDKSVDNLAQTSTTTKETTRNLSPTTVGILVGARLSFDSQPLSYGGFAYKPIVGPVGIGVWGLETGFGISGGVAVGLSF